MTTLHGHPVYHFCIVQLQWLTTTIEWTLETDSQRPMDAIANSFCTVSSCSCGALHVINGNQAVTYGGDAALSQTGRGPYHDPDGRKSCVLHSNNFDSHWNYISIR